MSPAPVALTTLHAAWREIATGVSPLPVERVALADAGGCVLTQPPFATSDYPPFDRSTMDGYALRAADAAMPGAILAVAGSVAAGQVRDAARAPGSVVWINTGAALPPGADAVIPVERTQRVGDRVRLEVAATAGQNVSRAGSVRRIGEPLFSAPCRLGAAQLAALAADGRGEVEVVRPPVVAIVVTGDELRTAHEGLAAGAIFDSNGPALARLAAECGGRPVVVGRAGDDEAALRERIGAALREPIVVITGGMSKGTLDLVPRVCEALGVEWQFRGVSLRPGKPTGFGVGPAGQAVFGLPGNPLSCMVCFLAFVWLAIARASGLAWEAPPRLAVRLNGELAAARDPRPAFRPARWWIDADGRAVATALPWRGSGDPFAAAGGNGLLFQPQGDARLADGAAVELLPLPGGWPTLDA